MANGAREITPMTFLNDDHGKSTIRDFSPKPQAVERRLESVPEPEPDVIAVEVEVPVLSPEEVEALAAEAARADAELTAGQPDPNSPPVVAAGTPEATDEAQPVLPITPEPAPRKGPAPA